MPRCGGTVCRPFSAVPVIADLAWIGPDDPSPDPADPSPGQSFGDNLRGWFRKPVFWLVVVVVLAIPVWAYMVGGRTLEGAFVVMLAGLPVYGGVYLLYFLPSLIARKNPNVSSVFLVNLFLGWTLLVGLSL